MNKMPITTNKSRRLSWLADLLYLVYPDLCLVCGTSLNRDETSLCHNCLYQLPKIYSLSYTENEAAAHFYGKLPFIKAAAGLKYIKESHVQYLMEELKYKGKKEIGRLLAGYVGTTLARNGFFDDIDLLVPVPLHPKKQKQRGYNQSEWIVKGLSDISGKPADLSTLKRVIENQTQTTRQVYDRWQNVASIFSLEKAGPFENKHILLVDDVLTSGSTLEACGKAVLKAEGARVSFFTLAMA
ncbi:MAG: ComF family protein [Bacteroidota bacterium]|nr:ComF family protein [Bacteroidota bacterium]